MRKSTLRIHHWPCGIHGRKVDPTFVGAWARGSSLVRPGSEKKLPRGCTPVVGNALDGASYANQIAPEDAFVQLVEVAPKPCEGSGVQQGGSGFRLGCGGCRQVCGDSLLCHLRVAHPAPTMHAYIAVRGECGGCHRIDRAQRHNSAAMVRAGLRTLVAVSVAAYL